MNREEFFDLAKHNPEALFQIFQQLQIQVQLLTQKVQDLEARLAQNSTNSHRPPSSNLFKPPNPKSLREKTSKKPGGQKGHQGETLKMSPTPQHFIIHPLKVCSYCSSSLKTTLPQGYEQRQVFDIPPRTLEVTEHQAEFKTCPHCKKRSYASFPQEVKQVVQYGKHLKALTTYLNTYQLLPYKRIAETIQDLFGHTLSLGTLCRINNECYELLEPVEVLIQEQLIQAEVVHCDESGIGVKGKLGWLHVASTPQVTLYKAHAKRGYEAIKEMGILDKLKGRAIHDHWKAYFQFACKHGLCNAHHLRELTYLEEEYGQIWASSMKRCLKKMKKLVEEKREKVSKLSSKVLSKWSRKYERLVRAGYKENLKREEEIPKIKKRGRVKQSKSLNLLDRLKEYQAEVLAFLYDFRVPFDNNLAERDIRMIKVKNKISGTFRSEQGAKIFCRIRSYISSVRKQGKNVMEALTKAFEGIPFLLSPSI